MYPYRILNKKKFLPHLINAIAVNIVIYIAPVFIGIFITEPFTINNFLWLIMTLAILKTLETIMTYIWSRWSYTFILDFGNSLQIKYFERINNMPIHKLNESHSGYLKKQIDIVTAESDNFINLAMDVIVGTTISMSIFLVTIFIQSRTIFAICVVIIIITVLISLYFSKKTVPLQRQYNETNSNYASVYVDLLQNIKTVKKLDSEKWECLCMTNLTLSLAQPPLQAN